MQCPTGQCVESQSQCSSSFQCPVGLKRCIDGICSQNCTAEEDVCLLQGQRRCVEGVYEGLCLPFICSQMIDDLRKKRFKNSHMLQ